jgi:hypothetical protein
MKKLHSMAIVSGPIYEPNNFGIGAYSSTKLFLCDPVGTDVRI